MDSGDLRALAVALNKGYRMVRTEEEFRELPVGATGYFGGYHPNATFSKMDDKRWYSSHSAWYDFSGGAPSLPFTRHDDKDLRALAADALLELASLKEVR